MRMENLVLSLQAVVIFGIYLQTLSPNIAGGDSGELVAEGCILGTAHPPGYPLLTMIVYFLKEYIPLSLEDYPVAYRVNVLSAVFTLVAAFGIGKTVMLLSANINVNSWNVNLAGAMFASGMFAMSPLVWQYAVTAEVFPLNTMLSSLIIYFTVLFSTTGNLYISHIGALVCGVALCNQHTIILFEVPLILWMIYLLRNKVLADYTVLTSHAAITLIGMSCYIYLPVVATMSPKAGSWGYLGNFAGFLHHFLRKDYGTFQLFSGNSGKETAGLVERTIAYFYDAMFVQGFWVIVPFATLHVYIVLKEYLDRHNSRTRRSGRKIAFVESTGKKGSVGKKKMGHNIKDNGDVKDSKSSEQNSVVKDGREYIHMVLIVTFVFYFLIFHSLSNLPLDNRLLYGVHQRFWMQPSVILFAIGGLGFNDFAKFLLKAVNDQFPFYATTVCKILLAISLFLCVCQTHMWHDQSDQSDAYYFRDYAKALLDPLPPSSLLIINYDMQWTSVRYMQSCENLRSDVTVINLSMMTYEWFQHQRSLFPSNITFPGLYHSQEGSAAVRSKTAFTFSQFVAANPHHRIYFSGRLSFRDSVFDSMYDHEPFGLVSRIIRRNAMPSGSEYSTVLKTSWHTVAENVLKKLPPESKYPEETWEWTIQRDMKDRLVDTSSFFLQIAISEAKQDPLGLVDSVYWLESTLFFEGGVNGSATTSLLKNTGLAHVNMIQNKLLPSDSLPNRPLGDVLNTLQHINWPTTSWKTWSTDRFLATWGEFLKRPDATHDSQFDTIKKMYAVATGGANSKANKNQIEP